MPKNTIVWKNTRSSSNKKTWRDYTYDKEYQASEKRKKYRAKLNKVARAKWVYGNKDGLDLSHGADWSITMEEASKNRARNWHGWPKLRPVTWARKRKSLKITKKS